MTDQIITEKISLELVGHEAIVLETYKDSVGIWTWGVGVTDSSGHAVGRYKDLPQTVVRCLEVYEWLLREKYLPPVFKAFKDHDLKEHELGAALSFHYNTGAINRASWVKKFLAGDINASRKSIMAWNKGGGKVIPGLTERRKKERDLFFDGKWSADSKATIYPVKKPSYTPDFARGERVDISNAMRTALKG